MKLRIKSTLVTLFAVFVIIVLIYILNELRNQKQEEIGKQESPSAVTNGMSPGENSINI